MIAATVFCLTTATRSFARRPFPFPCSVNGSAPLSCPLTKNCMQISTPQRAGGVVKCAARPLLQALTVSNTARTAGNEYCADKPQNASGNSGYCHAVGAKSPCIMGLSEGENQAGKGLIPFPFKTAFYRVTGRRKQHPQKDRARWPVIGCRARFFLFFSSTN